MTKPGIETESVVEQAALAERMFSLVGELFPICRSIAGPGLRQTLQRLGNEIPLQFTEVPSGTTVLDWTVPDEWECRDAYIKNQRGQRVVDFQAHNLHVVNYSRPIHAMVSRQELESHLHSLPAHPDWIPYRTSYYAPTWGFCVSQRQRETLTDQQYEVCIDSQLRAGSMTYAEFVLPGEVDHEVVFTAHACHPSLANDNLASIAVAVELARWLSQAPRRYTYRIVFAPGTIGAIAWLHQHRDTLAKIRYGLVLALLGRPGPLVYKKSRQQDAPLDRLACRLMAEGNQPSRIEDFSPYGYDERQYCSPGFNLPFGRLTREPQAAYAEYHTSADNLDLITVETMIGSWLFCQQLIQQIEATTFYRNLVPYGEPQLGRRGLYQQLGGEPHSQQVQLALLWCLNLGDGHHSAIDVAMKSGLELAVIETALSKLCEHELMEAVP